MPNAKKIKKPRFVSAPQIKQELVNDVQDIFLEKVLGIEGGAYITDESFISDFISHPKDKAIREGSGGKMIFKVKMYVGPKHNMIRDFDRWKTAFKKTENWEWKEIEDYAGLSKQEVIDRTLDIFGTDITEIYEKPLVDILLKIAPNIRAKLKKKG